VIECARAPYRKCRSNVKLSGLPRKPNHRLTLAVVKAARGMGHLNLLYIVHLLMDRGDKPNS
jgi:hypothetical protein